MVITIDFESIFFIIQDFYFQFNIRIGESFVNNYDKKEVYIYLIAFDQYKERANFIKVFNPINSR